MKSKTNSASAFTEKCEFDEIQSVGKLEYTTGMELELHLMRSIKNGRWFVMAQEYDKKTGEPNMDVRKGDGLWLSEYTLTRLIALLQNARQEIGSLQTHKRTEAA